MSRQCTVSRKCKKIQGVTFEGNYLPHLLTCDVMSDFAQITFALKQDQNTKLSALKTEWCKDMSRTRGRPQVRNTLSGAVQHGINRCEYSITATREIKL